MKISIQVIERIIFRQYEEAPRFTQDSPVYPDVWLEYFEDIKNLSTCRQDLILMPHFRSNAGELFKAVNDTLKNSSRENASEWQLASNSVTIAVRLTFDELVRLIIPYSSWWKRTYDQPPGNESWLWFTTLVGAFLYAADHPEEVADQDAFISRINEAEERDLHRKFAAYFTERRINFLTPYREYIGILYSVSKNRPASITIHQSIGTTKADAGRRLFDVDGSNIFWAVLDSGIDARNMAFRKVSPKSNKPYKKYFWDERDRFIDPNDPDPNPDFDPFDPDPDADTDPNHTRIVATYDFTKFRDVLTKIHETQNLGIDSSANRDLEIKGFLKDRQLSGVDVYDYMRDIAKALENGRSLDWSIIAPLLRIPHNIDYDPPKNPHGTHVAGIIGACERKEGKEKAKALIGMCPGIQLYDIRVMKENGKGEEFNILAGLHFVRWLNNQKDDFAIHGVNLSLGVRHDVAGYACGQTPVCEACERLVAEGAVVVASAGNLGQAIYTAPNRSQDQGFRMVNITDPGNAQSVITVGATHRFKPHMYGVSYFSSKGPTGDGRLKPDLVAPGEKITSCVIADGQKEMDGTSMAAPHVSGAAALLLAKHQELIGNPEKVKEILCKTATDLGREKYFQGHGMIDVLRAMQFV